MIEFQKNNTGMVGLQKNNASLSFSETVLKGDKGEDGGYYKPSINGNLISWQPSKTDMPPVDDSTLTLRAEDVSYTLSEDIQNEFPELAVLESNTVKGGLDLAMYYALAGMLADNISVNIPGGTSSISLQNLYDYSILPAIEKAHEHSNKPVLDNLSVSNGKLQYNGSDISVTKDNIVAALGYTPKAVSQEVYYPGSNITLEDNTEYRLTNVTTLNLTYPTDNFECWMRLSFAANGDATVTLPVDTKYLGAIPNFKNGETWELGFKDKVLAAQKVGDGT